MQKIKRIFCNEENGLRNKWGKCAFRDFNHKLRCVIYDGVWVWVCVENLEDYGCSQAQSLGVYLYIYIGGSKIGGSLVMT